jgi:hypothetical protein
MRCFVHLALACSLAALGLADAEARQAPPGDDPHLGAAERRGRLEALISEVVGLRDAATRQGEAIRLSCISERLKRLRALGAKPQRPRSTAENDEVEARAKALTAEAHACVEVRPDELVVEVTEVGLPDLPAIAPLPPPNFERPPPASPY